MKLKSKTALVTGATSNIGRAIALGFAREGASVVVVGRNQANGADVVSAIESLGQSAVFAAADVTDETAVKEAVHTTLATFGRLDILVNCAGLAHLSALVDTPSEEWDRVFGVNLKSIFLFAKYSLPHMMSAGSGSILNISSAGGLAAVPNEGIYNTAKAAVLALTRNMALEYAGYGIRVNCICPGPMELGMKDIIIQEAIVPGTKPLPPLGKFGSADEIGEAAVFLASSAASSITGQTLVADGGLFLGLRA